MRKSSSRRSQEQLQLFECSPNFPSVRCENLHSITIKRLLRAVPCCRSVIEEFAHAFNCAYIELWMHLGSARVALGCASSYSHAFFMLSNLPACIHNSIYARQA